MLYELTNNDGWIYASIPFVSNVTYQGVFAGLISLNGMLSLVVVLEQQKRKLATQDGDVQAKQLIAENILPGFATNTESPKVRTTGWEDFIDSLMKRINGTDISKESYAIGIVGEWGAGKTTFLQQIEEKLQPMYRVIKFNPLNSLSPGQLIDDFFSMLSNAVSDNKTVVNAIKKYMGVLNDIDLIPKWGSMLSKYVLKDDQPQNISTVKDAVQDALEKYPRRVAVLIDDLDRLEKDELFEVLRIVRITANFRNLVFIVAYDREHVDRMLREKSITDINYLKKIFPLEISLPSYEKFTLPRMLENELAAIFGTREVVANLSGNIYYRDENGMYVIQNYLKNFRDVKRFASSFALNASHIMSKYKAEEFCLFELFWLELLRYEDYKTYETLRINCYQYLKQTSDNDGGIKLVLISEKEKGQLSQSSFYILRILFSRTRVNIMPCSIRYIGNFNNYFSYRILDDTISVNEFKSLYTMESTALEEAVDTICSTSVERIEAFRQYLLRSEPRKMKNIELRKNYIAMLIYFMPHSTYEQNAKDLRSKLNKNIYPEVEREELKSHLCKLMDESIGQNKVKGAWWMNCLSEMVAYYDITPDDEYPYANEYSSLLDDNDLKQRAHVLFERGVADMEKVPVITDITRYGSPINRLVRLGTGKAGEDNEYDYNDRYCEIRYTSLIFDDLLKLYEGDHSKEWKKFVEPFEDEDLWEYDQQNAIINYHNKVRALFGTIDNYLKFVNTCFDDDKEKRLEKHLVVWGVK
jgi:hypothetical protein